jgi:hypothetical protein
MSQQTATNAQSSLTDEQVDRFRESGLLVLPGFLRDDLVDRLRPEVDRWVDDGLRARAIAGAVEPEKYGPPPVLEFDLPAHAELLAYPPLMELLTQLLGPDFAFHHMHSDRQAPALPGKPWHHDYEQRPQRDRRHTMVHALHYLDGIDRETSSLVVLPGSHREVAEKDARAHLGTGQLPGERVLDDLPRGSTVLVHSAVFHARRRRPDGTGKDRYFVDASYCQAGIRWPQVKPYWREMLSRARDLDIGGGWWPELFAEHHFYD